MLIRADSGVIRLFRFRPVRAAFDAILRDVMIPDLVRAPGVSEILVGRQGPDELGPRLVASVWSSREAMAATVGETFDDPPFHPEYLDETRDRILDIEPLAFGFRFDGAHPPGVLRLVRGRVRPGELDVYVVEAREGTLADVAAERGPIALYLATEPGDRFVTLSVWSDWATLQAATGGRVGQPIATRHAQRLVEWEAAHYEALPQVAGPERPLAAIV